MLARETTNLISRRLQSSYIIKPRWFYATDVPNTKPHEPGYVRLQNPHKFIAFTWYDSEKLERFYTLDQECNKSIPVNEDHLFEVNLRKRELRPIYWEGATYEVRRGLWFKDNNLPLTEDLQVELEEISNQLNHNKIFAENDVHRLKGKYEEGKIVVLIEKNLAYIVPELYGGKLQLQYLRSNLFQFMQVHATKVTRGYVEKKSLTEKAQNLDIQIFDQNNQLGKLSDMIGWEIKDIISTKTGKHDTLNKNDREHVNESMMQKEMETDYHNKNEGDHALNPSNHRNISHLMFCVHGIGQTLGKKYQHINFTHSVNLLRNNMNQIYRDNEHLKELNRKQYDDWRDNNRVQVLPITWRHYIGFNTDDKQCNTDNYELPTLNDITVDGLKSLRKLLGDIALDILLYEEPYYRERILKEVSQQLNKFYKKFCLNNPSFDGEVSLIGHSLGSLIVFDILCHPDQFKLDFKVKNYFSIGSPISVFKLIQKTKITHAEDKSYVPIGINMNKPHCQSFYNIFHTCDPVAYRIEPLVDRRLSKYQQEVIPHISTGSQITAKMFELGGSLITGGNDAAVNKVRMPRDLLDKVIRLNRTGRIDYSFQPGILEMDAWNTIKSHVSYFEELDTAGFILNELLKEDKKIEERFCKVVKN